MKKRIADFVDYMRYIVMHPRIAVLEYFRLKRAVKAARIRLAAFKKSRGYTT